MSLQFNFARNRRPDFPFSFVVGGSKPRSAALNSLEGMTSAIGRWLVVCISTSIHYLQNDFVRKCGPDILES